MPTSPNPIGGNRQYGEGEPIYEATTAVVRSVMRLSEGVRAHQTDSYVELVCQTGLALRGLLAAVDALPLSELEAGLGTRRVEPAQRMLSSDMAALVAAMKLAVQRPAESDQRRAMLQAAHSLAVDAKNLLDTVDSIRAPGAAGVPGPAPSTSSSPSLHNVGHKGGSLPSANYGQSESGSSMFGDSVLRSEGSTPRSTTPTSFR